MRQGILGALLALSLVGSAWGEVIRANATTFNPEGPKSNQMQDIPAAHKLGGDAQTQKIVVSLKSSLPAYLEKANLDTAVHRGSDFEAASGTQLSSKITPQAAFGGGGKTAPSTNKLSPIKL